MKKFFVLFIAYVGIIQACNQQNASTEHDGANAGESFQTTTDTQASSIPSDWETYSNQLYQYTLQYPASWNVVEDSTSLHTPIINVYNPAIESELPLTIHADAGISHVSIFPKGLGTEGPTGRQMRLDSIDQQNPVSIQLNEQESVAYLLEDGTVWGYFLKPQTPPAGWNEYGFIFAQIGVQDFRAICLDKQSGKEKSMQNCDPFSGDHIAKYGTVDSSEKQIIMNVLQSFRFTTEETTQSPVTDLIHVENPQPDERVRSPITVKGEARGPWFFEGQFQILLQDSAHNTLAQAPATAQGKWMTEDFVPFKATLSFQDPTHERGYLVFQKANPSGMPEHDRSFTVPVRFASPEL